MTAQDKPLINLQVPVLDKGFIKVIDYMGDDNAVVQAARVSYGEGTTTVREDRGLIRYLMKHRHTSPFEMCEIKLHCKMPIFVARQWVRHRTASINEYSARYSVLADDFYMPAGEDVLKQSSSNKQGRSGELTDDQKVHILNTIQENGKGAYLIYQQFIDDDIDLARELARMVLPLNIYTEWYWKIDVHNLMHFLGLRADPHAQKEIRVYAEAMLDILKQWMPHTHEAFMDYHMNAHTFSAGESLLLSSLVRNAPETVQLIEDWVPDHMSKREWHEFWAKLEVIGVKT